jgi:hypothetical protein
LLTTDLKIGGGKLLPNLRATTDSLWQYEKIVKFNKLLELSVPEI